MCVGCWTCSSRCIESMSLHSTPGGLRIRAVSPRETPVVLSHQDRKTGISILLECKALAVASLSVNSSFSPSFYTSNFHRKASIESVLQAAAVLSNISKVHVQDLIPHRNELENAFVNLQKLKLLKTGISTNRLDTGTTGDGASTGSNNSESNIGEVSDSSPLECLLIFSSPLMTDTEQL